MGSLLARLVPSSASRFSPSPCLKVFPFSLHQAHYLHFLHFHPPDKYHPFSLQTYLNFLDPFPDGFTSCQASRRLETLSLLKGKHHGCPRQAGANSATCSTVQACSWLHLYYYIQLALIQPRSQGHGLLSSSSPRTECLHPNCPTLPRLLLGTIWKTARLHRPQLYWAHTRKRPINAWQTLKPIFASALFPSTNVVLAARTGPTMKGSSSQPAGSGIPTQSYKVSSAGHCQMVTPFYLTISQEPQRNKNKLFTFSWKGKQTPLILPYDVPEI